MGTRSVTICDLCNDAGKQVEGRTVLVGAWNAREPHWFSLDLCEDHELTLFGELESLLDTVGSEVQGPRPEVTS